MSESMAKPRRQRKKLLSRWGFSANHLGVATSLVALAISLWSTSIAQQTRNEQEEGLRRAQADQVVIFTDFQPSGLDPEMGTPPPYRPPDTYVRNYSRLPIHYIVLQLEVRDQSRTTKLMNYTLGALGPC